MPTRTRTEVRSSHLRAFRLPSVAGFDRVALVAEQAVLLAGDAVTVDVRVGPGQALEIVETGGTVAYAMRGGGARWDVRVEVDPGGHLIWDGQPFVVAEGADVTRTLGAELARDASAVLRETLVLGRVREGPGRLVSRSRVCRDGVEILVDELDTCVGMGRHRVLDQVLHLGSPCVADELTLALESGGLLHRWLGNTTHQSPVGGCLFPVARPEPGW